MGNIITFTLFFGLLCLIGYDLLSDIMGPRRHWTWQMFKEKIIFPNKDLW